MTIAIQFRPHRRRSRLAATVVKIGERATLAASLDGKPVTEFEITIYQSGEKNARGLASNQNATLTLPKLHRATYTIYVRTAKNFCDFLCLDLSKEKNDAKDSFSAALRPLLPHEPTVQELPVAKYVAVKRSRVFAGVVQDPSRTGISGVSIHVLQKHRGGKSRQAVREMMEAASILNSSRIL